LPSEQARRRREDTVVGWALAERGALGADERRSGDIDDTLVLPFLCCHPSLSVASQVALTLRAVGGLSAAEIARALLGSEQTVTRRITPAKQSITTSGVPFALPDADELGGRLDAVLRVLYLIFNEGYASTTGTALVRVEAKSPEATDWPQIVAPYGVLLRLDDNPVVALNHAVAVGMVAGPRPGLELVQRLGADSRVNADRRFHAVRGHLLEMAGDRAAAIEAYRAATRAATNLQQQRYLNQQITRLRSRKKTSGDINRTVDAFGRATIPAGGESATASTPPGGATR
jgi:predicted RNA polymerase sigma factor